MHDIWANPVAIKPKFFIQHPPKKKWFPQKTTRILKCLDPRIYSLLKNNDKNDPMALFFTD